MRRVQPAYLFSITGLVVTALLVPTVPTSAATGTGSRTQSTRTVTIFLRAPHPAALAALADDHGLTHAARIEALDKLLPTTTERRVATAVLQARGLHVTGDSAWSVTATAAAASTVAASFGQRPVMPADPTVAERKAAQGPLPRLPAALATVAVAAYPTAGGPGSFHSSSALSGSKLRNAYTSPIRTAAGFSAYSGADSKANLTIATIQLAGWNSSDLATYAQYADLPYSSNTLTQVPIDQSTVPSASSNDDSDVEVDLDQESMLSTDPYAHQRAYFAPNTVAGFADAYSQVLDDVLQNSDAYQGGDPNIVALSTSWGECEAETGGAEIRQVLEPIMESLDAAGVTLFAATGDDGAYDECAVGPAVDYPASSPEVVGVGGTSLTSSNEAANTGSNWSETAWTCTSRSDCASNGGSGGGESALFGVPSYQSAALSAAPYSAAAGRLVPDIASDANPSSGITVYSSDPSAASSGGLLQIGGTSLAAPTQAALFTDMLAAHAATTGIGDIHRELYAALGDSNAFRDVTSGSNGASSDARSGSSTKAAAGYDSVTGLGGPLWPGIAAYLYPSNSPTVSASVSLPRLDDRATSSQVRVAWSSTAATSGPGVVASSLRAVRVGSAGSVVNLTRSASFGAVTFAGRPGSTYLITATAADGTGDVSVPVSRSVAVPVDNQNFRLHGAWRRLHSRTAVAASYVTSNSRRVSATVSATGRVYYLKVRLGPSLGRVIVTVAGKRVDVINLHARRSGWRIVKVYTAGTATSRRVRLSPRGHGQIAFDALWVLR